MTQKPISGLPGNSAKRPSASALAFRLDGAEADVRDGMQRVEAWLARCSVPDGTRSRLLIALAEALNNIVEHALAGRSDGRIEVSLSETDSGIDVEIADDGRAMPGGNLPPRRPHDLNVPRADLPEGGFGWDLIREIAAEIGYHRVAGRNKLTFRVPTARCPEQG